MSETILFDEEGVKIMPQAMTVENGLSWSSSNKETIEPLKIFPLNGVTEIRCVNINTVSPSEAWSSARCSLRFWCAFAAVLLLSGCLEAEKFLFVKYDKPADRFDVLYVYMGISAQESKEVDYLYQLWQNRDHIIHRPQSFQIFGKSEKALLRLSDTKYVEFDLGNAPVELKSFDSPIPLREIQISPGAFFLEEADSLCYYAKTTVPGKIVDALLHDVTEDLTKTLASSISSEVQRRREGERPALWADVRKDSLSAVRSLVGLTPNTEGNDKQKEHRTSNEGQKGLPLDDVSLNRLLDAAKTNALQFTRDKQLLSLILPVSDDDSREIALLWKAVSQEITAEALRNGGLQDLAKCLPAISVRNTAQGAAISVNLELLLPQRELQMSLNGKWRPNFSDVIRRHNTVDAIKRRGVQIDKSLRAASVMNSFFDSSLRFFPSSVSISPGAGLVQEPRQNGSQSREPQIIPLVDVVTVENIDEQLFLLRFLEQLYSEWPTNISDPQTLQRAIRNIRHRANRHYEDIKQRKLDEALVLLYADFLNAVDSYTAFLADIGRIERAAAARAEMETTETGFNAGFIGGRAAADLNQRGNSDGDALLGGAAATALTFLWEDYNKAKVRDEAKQLAITEAHQQLERQLSTYLARCQNAAVNLTERYSWRQGEAGFETPTQARLSKTRRPRDPFAIAQNANLLSLDPKCSDSELLAATKECLKAASLVPKRQIYDECRAYCLFVAGGIAFRTATNRIAATDTWADAYSEPAAYGVGVLNECLKFTKDSTGEIREIRAWSLMQSGHIKEAFEQANSICSLRQNAVSFAYNFARLNSVLNDSDTSMKWLEHAVRNLGWSRIVETKQDPHFRYLRSSSKARAFQSLTEVKFTWGIQFGLLNDDITITNNSAFTLTNVVLECDIAGGGKTFTPTLKVKELRTLQTYKWENVINVPGSKTERGTATLSCDQNWRSKDGL